MATKRAASVAATATPASFEPPAGASMQHVNVDFAQRGPEPRVKETQYDATLPVIAVHMLDGGKPYEPPAGAVLTARMAKPDGTHVLNPVAGVADGVAYIACTQQMLAAAGTACAVVEVSTGTGGVLKTSRLILDIAADPVPQHAIESKDEFKTLTELLALIQATAEQVTKDKTAAAASAKTATDKAAAAAASATEAKASETAAAGSAKTAGDKATEATSSATAAKASETAAAANAKTATDKATAASASADAAKTSEDNAAASETAAAESAEAAKTSETNAGASKTAAANSAAAAKTSETNAAGSKTAAANSAAAAKTSETNAGASKTAAAGSAAAAKTSETNAQAAADRAEDAANRAGGVKTVNGTAPDANGNVDVEALPPGGTTGQALLKASNQDGDANWADMDALPKGGATGNVLTKRSNADGDAAWLPADPGGGAAITNYDQIYPLGCYIYSSDTSFDPNTAYGGTWELVAAGVTLRQAGTGYVVGTQYGEAAHTLTAAEMPAHTHHINVSADRAGTKPCGYAEYVTNGSDNAYYTDAAGGGKAHNNVGPSLAVNIWHKTASEGGKVITAMTGDQLREYMHMRKYTAALPEAGWTREADGSYTQTVACVGMTADVQVWDVRGQPGATAADNLAIAEALGCITMTESLAGQVKVICGASRPAVDFTAVFKEE